MSVVDSKGLRIYDSLVKPDKPILDYLTRCVSVTLDHWSLLAYKADLCGCPTTRYSGLTAEKLENVATKLVDVQRDLAQLIDYNTILLGHSLDCDLRVLKVSLAISIGFDFERFVFTYSFFPSQLIHSFVIDTSAIYQHPRGPPFKASLKWLAQKWLKKEIQTAVAGADSAGGHDSEEDARTCVELLQLKMQKGASQSPIPWCSWIKIIERILFVSLSRSRIRRVCQRSRDDLRTNLSRTGSQGVGGSGSWYTRSMAWCESEFNYCM